MIDNERVRIMTRMSIYEKHEGKEDLKYNKYFKSDYARLQVLKTLVWTTIAYVIVVALVLLYKLEYVIDNALVLDYPDIGKQILAYYIVVLAVYLVGSLVGYSLKYQFSRKRLKKYYRLLKSLKDIYSEEDSYNGSRE
ncbi:MAG: hypothetical protein K6E95_02125 [Lachnospiraceae bacterium]|nr:hypothetical protein [Lachnospiraceae bacterium]